MKGRNMKKMIKMIKNTSEKEAREIALFIKMPRTIIDRRTGKQTYKS
jgi:hypothetical protein